MTEVLLSLCLFCFLRENFSHLYLTLRCVCCSMCVCLCVCFSKHFFWWLICNRPIHSICVCYMYFCVCISLIFHFLLFFQFRSLVSFFSAVKSTTIKFCQVCSLLLLQQRFHTRIFFSLSLSNNAHFFLSPYTFRSANTQCASFHLVNSTLFTFIKYL